MYVRSFLQIAKLTKSFLPIWLVTCASVFAQDSAIPKWAKHQNALAISWPNAFFGSVISEAGAPISDAVVSISVDAQIWTIGGIYEKELYRATTATGADGRYSFFTADIPPFSHRPLSITVTASAKGHVAWRTWWWYGMQDKDAHAKFSTLRLKQGRQLSGTCVDPNGKPIPNAVLRGYYSGSTRGSWGNTLLKCDENGSFSVLAPKDGHVGFWVYANNHGPNFFRVIEGEEKNLEFRLDQGSQVFGLVRFKDGSPIANAVVEAVSSDTGDLPAYSLPFRIAARTNPQGKFRLPPITGEYRFYLTPASQHMMDGGSYESPTQIPLSVPVTRTVKGGNRQNLILRESETAFVSGLVKWNNNEPAAGSMVRVSQMPEGNGAGFSLGRTVTDESGNYRIRIPVPIERLLVYVESRRRFGQHVRAIVTDSEDNEYSRFKRVTRDTSVNFIFKGPKIK